MADLSEEEQRQRVRELVRKDTGVDWPTLRVIDIENAFSGVTVYYWCREEHVGNSRLEEQLLLTDEEAEFIGVNRPH